MTTTRHGGQSATNTAPVSAHALPVVTTASPIAVHPDLAKLPPPTDVEVARRLDILAKGEPPITVATHDGKVVSYVGWIEARALGSNIKTVEIPPPSSARELGDYILGTLPVLRDNVQRAVACYLTTTKAEREAYSRELEVAGGKLGAARRHHSANKGAETVSAPKPPSYPRYITHFARVAGIDKPDVLRQVFKLGDKTPELFEMVRSREITHVGDAVLLSKSFTTAAHQTSCFRAWKAEHAKNPSLKLLEYLPEYRRKIREPLTPPSGDKNPHDVHEKGITLLFGDMNERGREVPASSVDVVYADVLYDDEHREPMCRSVSRYADRVCMPGGLLILCAGNFYVRGACNAVMEEADWEDAIVLTVHYHGVKLGKANRGIGTIDSIPFFLFRKRGGRSKDKIRHLHFVSEAQNNGEPLHNAFQKNPRMLADIFEAIRSSKPGLPPLRISDPCSGWGATGVAARRLGHEFVGIELSNEGRRYDLAVQAILAAKKGVWPKRVSHTGE